MNVVNLAFLAVMCEFLHLKHTGLLVLIKLSFLNLSKNCQKVFSSFFFFFPRDRHTKQEKMLHAIYIKTQLAAVDDCRTSQFVVILLCMHIQYGRSLPYRTDIRPVW